MKVIKLTTEPTEPQIYERLDTVEAVSKMLHKRVEAMACPTEELVSCSTMHALVQAAHDAFYDHNPLILRPDDVWLCIASGFANHIKQNNEELRHRFVSHEGREQLVVRRADFALGQDNPWPEVFGEFSEQIAGHVGKVKDLVCADFSTTTPTERIAFELCLMDGFQGYFEYIMRIGCGIPEIRLMGTPEDWRSIKTRLGVLSEYGLEDWVSALEPVLERIESASQGEQDIEFWRSFFRYESTSGTSELTGWILTLFPYLKSYGESELELNPYLGDWEARFARASSKTGWSDMDDAEGPWLSRIPQELSSAPVKCMDELTGEVTMLNFIGGMMGVAQAEDGALSPVFGWAVVYDES